MGGTCAFKLANIGAKVTGYTKVAATEAALLTAVANVGPISVAIYVDSDFDSYSSGVYYNANCQTNACKYNKCNPNHAVWIYLSNNIILDYIQSFHF